MEKHKITDYLTLLCDSMNCSVSDFNADFFEAFFALEHDDNRLMSYVVSAHQFVEVQANSPRNDFIVVPMFGKSVADFEDFEFTFDVAVKPRPDGKRVSCYMLARETVALTTVAPHLAGAYPGEDFHMLWLFDDVAKATSHFYSDDVSDSVRFARAIEDDHKSLTQEEHSAWQDIASQAEYIGFFDCIDLRDEKIAISNSDLSSLRSHTINKSNPPVLVDFNQDFVEFIWDSANQTAGTACYVARCDNVFSCFPGSPRNHCIVIPFQQRPSEVLAQSFGDGGIAKLTSDDAFTNVSIHNGVIRLPNWFAKNEEDHPHISHIVLISNGYAAQFHITSSLYSATGEPGTGSACFEVQETPKLEPARNLNGVVITIDHIIHVTYEDEIPDELDIIPF